MEEIVQLKATVPQALKRQAFSVMALQGLKFSPWVREQLERLVADQQAAESRLYQEGSGHKSALVAATIAGDDDKE